MHSALSNSVHIFLGGGGIADTCTKQILLGLMGGQAILEIMPIGASRKNLSVSSLMQSHLSTIKCTGCALIMKQSYYNLTFKLSFNWHNCTLTCICCFPQRQISLFQRRQFNVSSG